MYQQIILIGNLGNDDAAMRYTPTGTPVASFSMATSKTWTGQDGKKQSKTVWWRVSCWNKLAEIVAEYVKAGNLVTVIGELEDPRVWTDKDGNNRASLEITAREVKFLGGRGADDGDEAPAQRTERQTAQPPKRAPEPEIPF